MVESSTRTPTPQDVYTGLVTPNRDVPKPEDIYNVPVEFISCLIEIAPKIQASGAWWSLTGDLSENMLDVHVRPAEIEILTDGVGFGKIASALSSYKLTPVAVTERKLDREAEPDANKYPIYERSTCTEFTLRGVKVTIQGDYQLKVGEWEWGDAFLFEPVFINLAGVQIPLMPLRLRTEIYLMLGWGDRAKLLTEAYNRAHAFLHQMMEGP